MIFFPSPFLLFAFLTNQYAVYGSTNSGGDPIRILTMPDHDIETEDGTSPIFSYNISGGDPIRVLTMSDHDIKTEDGTSPIFSYNIAALLENELSIQDCNTIFYNNLKIDGRSLGPKYFTSKPEIVILGGMKYLHISWLHFFKSKIISEISLTDEKYDKYVEKMKRKLIKRSVFVGRNEHILVSNVIIGEVGYGPIFLPARFE